MQYEETVILKELSLEDLEKAINKNSKKGWVKYGYIFITQSQVSKEKNLKSLLSSTETRVFCQAMIKKSLK